MLVLITLFILQYFRSKPMLALVIAKTAQATIAIQAVSVPANIIQLFVHPQNFRICCSNSVFGTLRH